MRVCARCAARAAAHVAAAAGSGGRAELANLWAHHVRSRAGVFERRQGVESA